jgi:hypothetical protein
MRVPAPPTGKPAPGGDDDATVILPKRVPRARARWPWLAGGVVVVVAAVTVALLRSPQAPVPPPTQAVQVPAPAPAPPVPPPAPASRPSVAPAVPALPTADEAAILADQPEQLTEFRFAPESQVVVLDFPTLEQQGRMLNRVAALIEKAGLPRDRVLTDAELDAAINKSGDTVGSYYYGHDYPAAALARFFALADRDHVTLGEAEKRLRGMLEAWGWFAPDSRGALISLSRQGADTEITPAVRAAILHHELSHGAFFAEPAYADYVRHFWQTALTPAERDAVRKFLGSEDYDTADEDLMANEMQAYLMFTYDPHFFLPGNIGMTEARRAELQADFRRNLPIAWLREALAPPAPVPSPVPAAATTKVVLPPLSAPSGSRAPAAKPR